VISASPTPNVVAGPTSFYAVVVVSGDVVVAKPSPLECVTRDFSNLHFVDGQYRKAGTNGHTSPS
jgi:hypothetical protein